MPNFKTLISENSRVTVPAIVVENFDVESTSSGFLNDRDLNPRLNPCTQRFNGLVPTGTSGSPVWELSSGTGQIVDAYTDPLNPVVRTINFLANQGSFVPSILNGTTTSCYAYLYWDGSEIEIGYQEFAPKADELVDKLFLCAIISADGTNIDRVLPISLWDEPYTKLLLDYGAVNVDEAYPQPIANTMRLSFGGGDFKFAGRNAYNNPKKPHTVNLAAIAELSYTLVSPDGSVIGTETDFNFNRFWDGTQVVALSDSSHASAQFLYQFPSGGVVVVIGTKEYDTLRLAAETWDNYESGRQPARYRNNTYFSCAIAGIGTGTDISDFEQVVIEYAT